MSEIGVRPKLRFWARWARNRREKSDFKEFSFWAHKPIMNGKKNMSGFGIAQFWCPSSELGPNYNFRPRWARNRREKQDFKEFSFWNHEPLRNGKKNMLGFGIAQFCCPSYELGPNYDFGPRWAPNRREKSDFKEFSLWAYEPIRNGKKNMPGFGITQLWCPS